MKVAGLRRQVTVEATHHKADAGRRLRGSDTGRGLQGYAQQKAASDVSSQRLPEQRVDGRESLALGRGHGCQGGTW
jgi:hypothetical protein